MSVRDNANVTVTEYVDGSGKKRKKVRLNGPRSGPVRTGQKFHPAVLAKATELGWRMEDIDTERSSINEIVRKQD